MAARSTPKVLRHKAQGRAAFKAALPWELDTVPNYSERVAYSRNPCRVDRTTVTYPGLTAKSAVNPGLWDVTPSALKSLDVPDSFPGVPGITRTRIPTVSRVSRSQGRAGGSPYRLGTIPEMSPIRPNASLPPEQERVRFEPWLFFLWQNSRSGRSKCSPLPRDSELATS